MRKSISEKATIVLAGACCVAFLFGCDSTTSRIVQPVSGGSYDTDAETGLAAVPFEAEFLRHTGNADVNTDTIQVEMGDPGDPFDFIFGDPIYAPGQGIDEHGLDLAGPDEAGTYTVSGTLELLPGNYRLTTSCYPEGFGAYFTDGSDRATFSVTSAFDPAHFAGGAHDFSVQSVTGSCFWLGFVPVFGSSLEYLVASLFSPVGVDVPGWAGLPATVQVSEAFPPLLPAFTADLFADAGEIAVQVTPGSVDVELEDPADWMEWSMIFNGEEIVYYICGVEFAFGDAFLRPVTSALTDLELTYRNMAFKVAASLEGPCEVARAASPFEMTTPLDARETCECTALYKGSNP